MLKRLMSLSEGDFLRRLPRAVAPHKISKSGGSLEILLPGGRVGIVYQAQPDLKVASLSLPVLLVEIYFENISSEEISSFMTRFDKTYQRGGG